MVRGCDGQPWSSSSFCNPPHTRLPVPPLAPSGLLHIASRRKSKGSAAAQPASSLQGPAAQPASTTC
ncbi:hypothetical protein CRENBAI_001535 [Crenichthys baileyi]|uniref:Uncharacterized protein n=1 Tax=Crenichthys baileyi TaxID=28760 RepID=A0AAV9S8Y4_9TELE